jgi:hypothetical protein
VLFSKGSVLAETTRRDEQQLETFSPAASVLEKSCDIMRFTFD